MGGPARTITLRVHGTVAIAPLAEPLVIAMGARAGVDVIAIDELVTALELVSRAASTDVPRTVTVAYDDHSVNVTIEGVDVSRLRGGRSAIDSLVGSVDVRDNEVLLRVGR